MTVADHWCVASLPLSPAVLSNVKMAVLFQNYCYHNGMHFLNAHASFNLWVERCLQMIDPSVSMASWDFMLDAARYGTR